MWCLVYHQNRFYCLFIVLPFFTGFSAISCSPDIFKEHRIKAIALELHPTAMRKRGLEPDKICSFLYESRYTLDRRFKNMVLTLLPLTEEQH